MKKHTLLLFYEDIITKKENTVIKLNASRKLFEFANNSVKRISEKTFLFEKEKNNFSLDKLLKINVHCCFSYGVYDYEYDIKKLYIFLYVIYGFRLKAKNKSTSNSLSDYEIDFSDKIKASANLTAEIQGPCDMFVD
ncbi:hypothetical protein [Vibrio jasicida]|uniref:hypothetical protein n=1 Tax=Vibrio jasicida TaxID=766224 RepID=UPI0039094724